MTDLQLSKSFWLREFLRSEQAARMGREILPTEENIANLKLLCENVLQPIRDALGKVMTISSGLRPEWLNVAIGGAKHSEHMEGRAADFLIAGYTPYAATKAIKELNLPWNQLIHEFGQWTHASVPMAGQPPKREILTAHYVNGHVQYTPGVISL
jgi:zinc D-Ala-D-Ala carboxypeptidase